MYDYSVIHICLQALLPITVHQPNAEPVSKPTAAEQISAYCNTYPRVRLPIIDNQPTAN